MPNSPLDYQAIAKHCAQLQSNWGTFVTLCRQMDDIYMLRSTATPSEDWVKQTVAPEPRIKLDGAWRLLCASEPEWKVPAESPIKSQANSSQLENYAKAIISSASRVRQKPVWYDPAKSALLYGRAVVSILSTRQLLDAAGDPLAKARAQVVYDQTPILFRAISPELAFPDFDDLGLRSIYIKQSLRVGEVKTRFGAEAEAQLANRDENEKVDVGEYWDSSQHATFLAGADKPFTLENHTWGFVPYEVVDIEGSTDLFYMDSYDPVQPFLYTLYKSGMWDNLCIALTAMYTNAYVFGANPQLVYRRNSADKAGPVTDYSKIGGLLVIDLDEEIGPLVKQAIDPSILTAVQQAQQTIEESTIYSQALGQSLGSNAPYSMVALMQQAGRLPLVPYQRMLSAMFSNLMFKALSMIRIEGGSRKTANAKGTLEIDAKAIPEVFQIQANLDIAMPQDERQNVAVAAQAVGGPNPLLSLATARENYLHVGQSDLEQQQIWTERFSELEMQKRFQVQQAQVQAAIQQQMQAAQMQQQGGQPGQMPGGQPGQMPAGAGPQPQGGQPGELAPMAGGNQVQPGLPMSAPAQPGGMPPDQMQGMGGQ